MVEADALQLKTKVVRAGSELIGVAVHDGAAVVRFYGEATTFRPNRGAQEEAEGSGWMSESEVLVWQERSLAPGEDAFSFSVPKSCPPTTVGTRIRIVYRLELHAEPTVPPCAAEVRVEGAEAFVAGEVRAALSVAGEKELERAAAEQGEAGDGAADETESWLEKILPGPSRMDRILERAVRGKLVEPEDLIAMQATLYGYSRTLSQLQTAGTSGHESTDEAVLNGAMILERATYRPDETMSVKLELPDPNQAAECVLQLVQFEHSRCHGVESLTEVVVGTQRSRGPRPAVYRIAIPRGLAASVEGRRFHLGYVLRMMVAAQGQTLRASLPIRILGVPTAG